MTFPYATGVGTSSIDEMIAFAKRSGIAFQVTSTYRAEKGSYHGTHNATDLTADAGSMIRLASWLVGYAAYELELIHSGGGGFFVKDGRRVDASYYGAETVSQHYNHVHLAMTLGGVAAAGNGQSFGNELGLSSSSQFDGCVVPAGLIMGVLGGVAWEASQLIKFLLS